MDLSTVVLLGNNLVEQLVIETDFETAVWLAEKLELKREASWVVVMAVLMDIK